VKWNLVIVYGAAQLEDKEDFLAELINVCQWSSLSLLIEGEFNFHRFSSEKNKDMRKNRWTDLFNYIINIYGLRDIYLAGGQCTWSNNQQNSTLKKLDGFLMNNAWEDVFPLVKVHKMVRDVFWS
jgi:hypothetical protein